LARILLTLLSFILLIAPVAYGLYLHNFDLKTYLYPSLTNAKEVLAAQGINISYEGFKLREVDLSRGILKAELALSVHNPSAFTIDVEKLEFKVTCATHGEEVGRGLLRQEVKIPSGKSGVLTVDVSLTDLGVTHVVSQHLSTGPRAGCWVAALVDFTASLEDAYIQLKVEEVVVELHGSLGSIPMYLELGAAPPP